MARRPTIIDVARLAGVSKTTVARVVNGEFNLVREETRQRVLDAIEQLGYERNAIAGSLRTDRTFMIALSIPDIMNPFWPEVARGVQDTVEANGYTVVLLNNDWDADREQNHIRMMRRSQFDGLIINPTRITNDDLTDLHIPVVVLGGGDNFPDFDAVGSDTGMGVKLALEHLLDLGHTRIGLIAGLSRRRKANIRQSAYLAFHHEHGLPVDESLIVECPFTQESGFTAMQQLMSLDDPPTAIFCANDILAIGALIAAQKAGIRVPDDVSIMGMDDIYAAATTFPPLTTIAKPKYDIGVKAANFLLQRIEGTAPDVPRHRRLPCYLVQRGSTAPPVA